MLVADFCDLPKNLKDDIRFLLGYRMRMDTLESGLMDFFRILYGNL